VRPLAKPNSNSSNRHSRKPTKRRPTSGRCSCN